jgi:hypothetical protein
MRRKGERVSVKMTAEEWEEFQEWKSSRGAGPADDDADPDPDDDPDDADDDSDDDDDPDDDDDDDVITYKGTRYRREDSAPGKRQSAGRDRGTRSQRTPRAKTRAGRSEGKPRVSTQKKSAPAGDPIPGGSKTNRRLFT